ncbi:MAG: histidine phosphatase family protein [Dehalococcoidia bacterium]
MRRLILCRHGETPNNSERRFTGWADPSLTLMGRRQARALGRRLRGQALDAAYSSDLRRTVETANLVLRGRDGLEPRPEPALREANFGEWQGLTFAEAQARNPGQFTALLRRSADFRPPGGETILEVHERVTTSFAEIRGRHDGQNVLFVSSGGPLQILLTALFGMPPDSHWRLGMGNCSVSIVDFVQDEPLLTLLNDRTHLARLSVQPQRKLPTIGQAGE